MPYFGGYGYGAGQASSGSSGGSGASGASTAGGISSALSSALQIYLAYRQLKEGPPAVPPNKNAFDMQPTAQQFMKKEGY